MITGLFLIGIRIGIGMVFCGMWNQTELIKRGMDVLEDAVG
jgi:hypothetical protein